MRPKSLCLRYYFVDALMHSTNNVCFYEVRQRIYKKNGCMYALLFFVDALMRSTNNTFFMQCAGASTKK